MATLNLEHIRPLQEQLNAHPIYGAIRDMRDLQVFMEHHVFAVWDFMSLIKYLQQRVAPTGVPWMPHGDPSLIYYINQLMLEEESDIDTGGTSGYGSHYALYCRAMAEIAADSDAHGRFLALVAEEGIDGALYSDLVPLPARYFTETTFCFIREDKPHVVAAALAIGRERVIPGMFRQFLSRIQVGADQAPSFHDYLNRHIHRDQDFHAALSTRLTANLCADDPKCIEEAETAAEEAVCARIRFWDGTLEAVESRRAG